MCNCLMIRKHQYLDDRICNNCYVKNHHRVFDYGTKDVHSLYVNMFACNIYQYYVCMCAQLHLILILSGGREYKSKGPVHVARQGLTVFEMCASVRPSINMTGLICVNVCGTMYSGATLVKEMVLYGNPCRIHVQLTSVEETVNMALSHLNRRPVVPSTIENANTDMSRSNLTSSPQPQKKRKLLVCSHICCRDVVNDFGRMVVLHDRRQTSFV